MTRQVPPPYRPDRFHPVVIPPVPLEPVDLTAGYDAELLRQIGWAVGGYDEQRSPEMYNSRIYSNGRTIHMGIDVWGPEGTPVYAFADGCIFGAVDNDNPRDYGPTIITQHEIEGVPVWALHGHLSRESLYPHDVGDAVDAGEVIGRFGREKENGGWVPHLHFQLALEEPPVVDMPGVVHPRDREMARRIYPDPRLVLGPLY